MGIDVVATWKGQTEAEKKEQAESVFSIDAGKLGYLREAYHGGPYATCVLLPELWEEHVNPLDGIPIPARRLRERLPLTLKTAIERQQTVYEEPEESDTTRSVCQSFRDFVALCETHELRTGEPCHISAWY